MKPTFFFIYYTEKSISITSYFFHLQQTFLGQSEVEQRPYYNSVRLGQLSSGIHVKPDQLSCGINVRPDQLSCRQWLTPAAASG